MTEQATKQHKYALTHDQFEAIKSKLPSKVKPDSVAAAYEVMVRDRSAIEVAEEYKTTRQNVHRNCRYMFAAFLESVPTEIPDSWVRVAVTLPPDKAKSVQQLEAAELSKLKTQAKGKK